MHGATRRMENLVEKHLGKQLRKDGSSNALHAKRVRTILMSALELSGEMKSKAARVVIECAALGHDLLEDSPVKSREIESKFSPGVLAYIQELTNTEGDSHTNGYVRQMVAAPEEARLIKYADLCDNIFHASYSARALGLKWMKEYFLPIVDPMRKALDTVPFKKYKKTGEILKSGAALARAHLEESIRSLK